jgi:hypothetical protein
MVTGGSIPIWAGEGRDLRSHVPCEERPIARISEGPVASLSNPVFETGG